MLEPASAATTRLADWQQIEATLLALAEVRGPDKTFCPSEAARLIDPRGWRDLMGEVREVAESLRQDGRLLVTRKGLPVAATDPGGPIRLRRPDAGHEGRAQPVRG